MKLLPAEPLSVSVASAEPVTGLCVIQAPDVFGARLCVEKLPSVPGTSAFVIVAPFAPKAKPYCWDPAGMVM